MLVRDQFQNKIFGKYEVALKIFFHVRFFVFLGYLYLAQYGSADCRSRTFKFDCNKNDATDRCTVIHRSYLFKLYSCPLIVNWYNNTMVVISINSWLDITPFRCKVFIDN